MWDYRAKPVAVHDGDTVTMTLDVGFAHTAKLNLRLLGVYAPELGTPGAQEARAFVADWLSRHELVGGWGFLVKTSRLRGDAGESMTLGRYLATIETIDGSSCLNAEVIAYLAGHPEWGGGIGAPGSTPKAVTA